MDYNIFNYNNKLRALTLVLVLLTELLLLKLVRPALEPLFTLPPTSLVFLYSGKSIISVIYTKALGFCSIKVYASPGCFTQCIFYLTPPNYHSIQQLYFKIYIVSIYYINSLNIRRARRHGRQCCRRNSCR